MDVGLGCGLRRQRRPSNWNGLLPKYDALVFTWSNFWRQYQNTVSARWISVSGSTGWKREQILFLEVLHGINDDGEIISCLGETNWTIL
jgi:hypothetical protein